MLLHEQEFGSKFEAVMTHDAEDIIHPDEIHWINYYLDDYAMIQTPVLALPHPMKLWTYGIYCDDFAEFHTKDLPVRWLLGGFIPSSGVGTAYRRDALESLAEMQSNRIFAPDALTEDYENGIRLHRLGARQLFVPIVQRDGNVMATREFFPASFRAATRQRTRWITGIVFQGWERFGWGRGWERYWLWRDRKGLVGNPLSLLANLISFYGVVTWICCLLTGQPWGLARVLPATAVFLATLCAGPALAVRAWCSARIYGWRFALGVPVRALLGNLLNTRATIHAALHYARARLRDEPLAWLKTEHAYPTLAALTAHKRTLEEVLISAKLVQWKALAQALECRPEGRRLTDHLLLMKVLSEDNLLEALSLQQNLPAGRIEPGDLEQVVGRNVPARIMKEHRIVPVSVEEGALLLATPDSPSEALELELKRLTKLKVRFTLITRSNFEELLSKAMERGAKR
jgi:adsorption protein B